MIKKVLLEWLIFHQENNSKELAIASSKIYMKKNTFEMIKDGKHKKGDVLAIARVAAIMSVKKTSELIPLCHPINIEAVDINFKLNARKISVEALITCKTTNKTGIEMEALTGSFCICINNL